jgi:hypothetical protein
MKKLLISTICAIFISLFIIQSVYAASVYDLRIQKAFCNLQGYNYTNPENRWSTNDYCNLPNNVTCSWTDFRSGACGQQYRKAIPCAKEGEIVYTGFQKCCNGLDVQDEMEVQVDAYPKCIIHQNFLVKIWEFIIALF